MRFIFARCKAAAKAAAAAAAEAAAAAAALRPSPAGALPWYALGARGSQSWAQLTRRGGPGGDDGSISTYNSVYSEAVWQQLLGAMVPPTRRSARGTPSRETRGTSAVPGNEWDGLSALPRQGPSPALQLSRARVQERALAQAAEKAAQYKPETLQNAQEVYFHILLREELGVPTAADVSALPVPFSPSELEGCAGKPAPGGGKWMWRSEVRRRGNLFVRDQALLDTALKVLPGCTFPWGGVTWEVDRRVQSRAAQLR